MAEEPKPAEDKKEVICGICMQPITDEQRARYPGKWTHYNKEQDKSVDVHAICYGNLFL